ncbi:MAG: motility associated factor glycosyltransferase family protein [Aeromonadales bacterium]|nr:motility associated factor glycosyltransferase family protein [Aeromonadales bacterium]
MTSTNTTKNLITDESALDTLASKIGGLDEKDFAQINELSELQKQMSDFLIERFQNNIEAFKKYMPNIAKTFAHYTPKKTMEFFCMPNGIPNLIFIENNDILYKTFDPFALCKAQVDSILNKDCILQTHYNHEYDPYGQIHFKYLNQVVCIDESFKRDSSLSAAQLGSIANCVMVGIGLGYQLANLYEKIEIANLIIVEPNLDMFFASLHAFDWANLLAFLFENNYGIHLMLGQKPEQFYLDMESFYTTHGRFLSGTWLGYVHYSSKEIKDICDILMKDFNTVHSALGFFDDHLFGTSHACNAILNKKAFVQREPQMLNKFKNVPVFVIGSGPSLDHDIPFIRKNQDKAIIIACGTAVDTLYHAGIKPDIYACTERTPQIRDALDVIPDKNFFDDIILMSGDVVHPRTTELFKHTAIFGKPDEPFYLYAAAHFSEIKAVQPVQLMNPFVGNMGVSGAIYLGFENLFFFGLDNGKMVGTNNIHSVYTSLYTNCNKELAGHGNYKTGKLVEGNFGGQCETNYFFNLSCRNMDFVIEQATLKNKNLKCTNCSNGSKIPHAKPVHSEDLNFEKLKNVDKDAFKDFMYNKKTKVLETIDEEKLQTIFMPDAFNKVVDYISSELAKPVTTRVEGIQVLESVSEKLAFFKKSPDTYYYADAVEGSLQTIFIMASRILYNTSDVEECIAHYNKIIAVCLDFLDESKSLFKHIPDYVMWDHKKYHPNGVVGIDYPSTKATPFPKYATVKSIDFDDPQKVFEKRYE